VGIRNFSKDGYVFFRAEVMTFVGFLPAAGGGGGMACGY
jgi:hypothetical protein